MIIPFLLLILVDEQRLSFVEVFVRAFHYRHMKLVVRGFGERGEVGAGCSRRGMRRLRSVQVSSTNIKKCSFQKEN